MIYPLITKSCAIGVSYSSGHQDDGVLGSYAVEPGRLLPRFKTTLSARLQF